MTPLTSIAQFSFPSKHKLTKACKMIEKKYPTIPFSIISSSKHRFLLSIPRLHALPGSKLYFDLTNYGAVFLT